MFPKCKCELTPVIAFPAPTLSHHQKLKNETALRYKLGLARTGLAQLLLKHDKLQTTSFPELRIYIYIPIHIAYIFLVVPWSNAKENAASEIERER
ncbi:hypothetical protein CEXT_452851 [Caerostris extrusa]|uniref:Uncharacterized protein n=1 Tax=Caerostris extrusa TaxID=172846 RepID=A0AAV4V037_CAEEX|nr:hypothetical protein CEXT_452851 [Caerostris extrusa]